MLKKYKAHILLFAVASDDNDNADNDNADNNNSDDDRGGDDGEYGGVQQGWAD